MTWQLRPFSDWRVPARLTAWLRCLAIVKMVVALPCKRTTARPSWRDCVTSPTGPSRVARRAVHGQSIARLQHATGAAVSTLLKVMIDPSTPASTKVRAAHSVLEYSAKWIEIEDIEARVEELERAAEASPKDSDVCRPRHMGGRT